MSDGPNFLSALDALVPGFAAGKGRLGLAVSGGPDSLALLLLAHKALPGRVAAATVDHRLRAEAADEARFVADICAGLRVPHAILRSPDDIEGNVQSRARAVRYRLLDQWRVEQRLEWIATAHHADDQLETMLMRLARGSGVGGLAGIRPVNGHVVRPLLDWTKAELEGVCRAAGVTPCRDPSNEDADYDRVRMRNFLAATDFPVTPAAATRSAAALTQADAALGWMVERLTEERISHEGNSVLLDPADLPRELVRRLLLRALAMAEPGLAPRGEQLDRLIARLEAGESAMIGNLSCAGGGSWRIAPAPPRRTG